MGHACSLKGAIGAWEALLVEALARSPSAAASRASQPQIALGACTQGQVGPCVDFDLAGLGNDRLLAHHADPPEHAVHQQGMDGASAIRCWTVWESGRTHQLAVKTQCNPSCCVQ